MAKYATPVVRLIATTQLTTTINEDQVMEPIFGEFLKDHQIEWDYEGPRDEDLLPEIAGRLCYMSYGKGRNTNAAHLDHIKEVGHGSVIEHSNFTFQIEGVSRSLTHELVRHRAGAAYSQQSQRYVDESTASMIKPLAFKHLSPELLQRIDQFIDESQSIYTAIAEELMPQLKDEQPEADRTALRKQVRQTARSVLPNMTETRIIVTLNARALRHFIEMRGHPAADPEIRGLAMRMLELAREASPTVFNDYRVVTLPDGTTAAETDHRKV